jgi:hypothetical protein
VTGRADHAKRTLATIRPDDRRGAFQFGPFVDLEPGRYDVLWIGTVEKRGRADIDALSDGARKTHARRTVTLPRTKREGILAALRIDLADPAKGVEFRMFVHGAMLTLHRVEVHPAAN